MGRSHLPFLKSDENVVLTCNFEVVSAKQVHISDWLKDCHTTLYTGTGMLEIMHFQCVNLIHLQGQTQTSYQRLQVEIGNFK
jgi:hypothetical protein